MENYCKSQFGQDLNLIENIYKHKENGFFVEVGAYDGLSMSNTYLLEYKYNWKGICVECNPIHFNNLINNRPNCNNCRYAVYSEDDKTMDFINDDDGGCSGFVETNSHNFILHKQVIEVKTKKLSTILEKFNAPNFIEFLSIDTEGSEFDILNAHDFDKYLFGYICVEHNFIDGNRKKIRELLESKGYIFYRENNVDDDYIHNSIYNLNENSLN
jgi:FkbM family methyltransferase